MNNLTDEQLGAIMKTAKEERENSGAINMEDINIEVDESAELESEVKEGKIDSSFDLLTANLEGPKTSDISLFDIDGDTISTETEKQSLSEAAKDTYGLSDDDVAELLLLISSMKSDKNYPVYKNLPTHFKSIVDELCAENGVPKSNYNAVAKTILNELISDSKFNASMIDLEKALNEALNIPSISDMYSDSIRTVMEENIPTVADEIEETDPEKAKLLRQVKDRFEKSYNYEFAKEQYNTSSKVRKAIRRNDKELKRTITMVNFKNEKSNFKMNDFGDLPGVLNHILIEEPEIFGIGNLGVPSYLEKARDMKITDTDISKFCILLGESCRNLNPRDVVDASYMYYMMKNIVMLKYTKETKTEFAAELINNICDTIKFIRTKEAEFNGATVD